MMYNYLYMTTIQKDSPPELPGFEQLSAFEKKYVENLAGNYQLTAKCESAPLDTFEKGVAPALYKPASMLLPGNEIFNRTANYLTHHDSYEDTFEIGVDLGIEINNSSRNDRDKFLLFISTVEAIALMRNALGILKNKTMSDVEDVIALTILESDKPLKDKIKLLEVIDEAIDDIREKVDVEDDDFTFVRAHHSIVRLRNALTKLDETKHSVQVAYPTTDSFETTEGSEVEKNARLLTSEAMSHRKYGTKPAYIEASIGGSWVFYDGEDYKRKFNLSETASVAAVVYHVKETKPKDLRIGLRETQIEYGMKAYEVVGGLGEMDSDMELYIMQDGSITTDRHGINDLAVVFRDKPSVSHQIKAEISSNFYDLSMPISRSRQARNFPSFTQDEREDFDPIKDLLMPRIKSINDEKPAPENDDNTRIIREHDVTWFVRTLPNGWHASSEAVEEASKRGIILEENETFVREHTRGNSGERVFGYHAVRRLGPERVT